MFVCWLVACMVGWSVGWLVGSIDQQEDKRDPRKVTLPLIGCFFSLKINFVMTNNSGENLPEKKINTFKNEESKYGGSYLVQFVI